MADTYEQIMNALRTRNSEKLIQLLELDPTELTREYYEAGTLLHEAAYWNLESAI